MVHGDHTPPGDQDRHRQGNKKSMSTAVKKTKTPLAELTARQSVKELGFKHTDELEPFAGILGQERAETAIRFGVNMHRSGYNVYVMGESGTGRTSYIRHYLEGRSRGRWPPPTTGRTSTTSMTPANHRFCACPPVRGHRCGKISIPLLMS